MSVEGGAGVSGSILKGLINEVTNVMTCEIDLLWTIDCSMSWFLVLLSVISIRVILGGLIIQCFYLLFVCRVIA